MQGINYMDFIVIAIITIFAIFGFKRGFLRAIVGMLSLIASIALAWMLYPVATDLFTSLGFRNIVFEEIQDVMSSHIGNTEQISALPQFMREAATAGSAEIIASTATALTETVMNIISFISVLIIARIIIWIAQKLLIAVSKIPLIGFVNKLAGLALGAAQGLLITFILFSLIYAIVPMSNNSSLYSSIENSVIAGKVYEANPIINIFVSGEDNADQGTLQETENGE